MTVNRRKFLFLYPIISVVIILSLFFELFLDSDTSAVYASTDANGGTLNLLIAGLDDAAENTDVLMLVSLHENGEVNALQIPRDTYVKSVESKGKINHLYPLCIRKYGKKEGAEAFSKEISRLLGVPIDRYVVFNGSDFEELVDAFGGVTLSVPYSFSYPDKNGSVRIVPSGEQRLNGEDALAFVRYRSAYAEGDLGRLDAQMRFLASLANEVIACKDPVSYFRIYQKNYRKLLTNLGEKDIISIMRAYFGKRCKLNVRFMRLPGEACRGSDGAWYYALNRAGAAQMLSDSFLGAPPLHFDVQKAFLREGEQSFLNIYEAKSFEKLIYTLDEARRARVLHK